MKEFMSLVLSVALLSLSTVSHAKDLTQSSVDTQIAQTAVELEKVKQMSGLEFEVYMKTQANKLEEAGYSEQASTLRLYADQNIKTEFEGVIEDNLNDRASNGLLLGVAIVGCASIVMCPILIFLAICTFAELEPASDI